MITDLSGVDIVYVNSNMLHPLITECQLFKNIVEHNIEPIPKKYIYLPTGFKILNDVAIYLHVARFWGICDELSYKMYKFIFDHAKHDCKDLIEEFWMIQRIKSIRYLVEYGICYRLLDEASSQCDLTLLKFVIDRIGPAQE
jgi:hypothetical protein